MERNVLFVVLDTVRKDVFDEYASRIRRRSDVTFDQCRAASTWSVPSHASMFTGTLPHVHGLHADSFGSSRTFADIRNGTFLSSLSGRKIGLSANPYANSSFGFDTLFDEYHDFVAHESLFVGGLSPYLFDEQFSGRSLERPLTLLGSALSHDYPGRSLANVLWRLVDVDTTGKPVPGITDDGARTITRTALKTAPRREPFFMFINYMDAHVPLENKRHFDSALHSVPNTWSTEEIHKWEVNKDGEGTEEYFERYRELYGAAVDYLDRTVSWLIDSIQDRTGRETTVVVTADHGHNLGYPADDSLVHHDGSMSEGVLHVPLEIVNPPDGYADRYEGYLSHLSLGALIRNLSADKPWEADLTSEEITAETVGLGGTGDPRDYREFDPDEFAYWNRLIRCLYRDTEKFVWDSLGDTARYRLDPARPNWQEQIEGSVDVEALERDHFEIPATEYKRQALSRAERDGSSGGVVEERLRRLGYL